MTSICNISGYFMFIYRFLSMERADIFGLEAGRDWAE